MINGLFYAISVYKSFLGNTVVSDTGKLVLQKEAQNRKSSLNDSKTTHDLIVKFETNQINECITV